jgi:hypothetical protein
MSKIRILSVLSVFLINLLLFVHPVYVSAQIPSPDPTEAEIFKPLESRTRNKIILEQIRQKSAAGGKLNSGQTLNSEAASAVLVDSVETYGQNNPLSQIQFDDLKTKLNQNPLRLSRNTFYVTYFIQNSYYRQFLSDNGETLQAFLKRNSDQLSNMLKTADPPISGGLTVRRLIVIDDLVLFPISYAAGYETAGFMDSDGVFAFTGRYLPSQCAYYDAASRVDYGLLHELGHQVLRLNDQYNLDVNPGSLFGDGLINTLPEAWKTYFNSYRINVSNEDLMAVQGKKIQKFTALQLTRRQPHNFSQSLNDYLGWNPEFSPSVNLILKNGSAVVTPKTVRIYRSESGETAKIISGVPVYSGPLTGVNPASLFPPPVNSLIPDNSATLLLVAADNADNVYYRWLDIRDFNTAFWTGSSQMTVQTGSSTSAPTAIDWLIQYSRMPDSRPPKR